MGDRAGGPNRRVPIDDLSIRPARADEAATLSTLAFRSKAHWGYDELFMERCRAALTYTGDDCAQHMLVAELDGVLVGLAQFLGAPPTGVLADLFVDPPAIGRGVGTALLRHVIGDARDAGFTAIELDAEPHAVGFYARHGAQVIGTVASDAIPGRTLPRMRLCLQHREPEPAADPADRTGARRHRKNPGQGEPGWSSVHPGPCSR